MPRWDPNPIWEGEDAYIVGGGPSLHDFNWDLIRGKNTIGCNSAFVLGADIIKIVLFADVVWWLKIGKKGTEEFGGRVVGCMSKGHNAKEDCPWLLTMDRNSVRSVGKTDLCLAGNTGAMAINLALILGARRIFLLGFDMKLGKEKQANWHDQRYEPPNPQVYPRFVSSFAWFSKSIPKVFPGCEVFNVTEDSNLDAFPKVPLAEHFSPRAEIHWGLQDIEGVKNVSPC